jgi:dTDP-4-amino-4,6-dideoxygalactose transaminase
MKFKMKIPFFDYVQLHNTDYPVYASALESVIKRADFILREDLENFEKNLANFTGSKYCVGVGNGTDAIWLGLIAAGVKRGDEVILPTHTYVATADAVWAVGATPVLVDIGDDHLISPQAVEDAITQKTTAIIPVNLNGRAAPLDEILLIAEKNKLKVIEDNAQGLGAMLNGKMAGTFGVLGTLSFFPAKILGCLGDGGGIITDSEEIYRKIRSLRSHGRNDENLVVEWGYNSRLDNLQAAVLNAKMSILNQNIEQRRKIADKYFELLADCSEIVLPQAVSGDKDHFDSYQNYEIEARNRDSLRDFLMEKGVGTLIQWGGKGVHEFKLPGIIERDLTNAKRIISCMLMLPMNQYMTFQQVEYIAKCIKEFYSNKQIKL